MVPALIFVRSRTHIFTRCYIPICNRQHVIITAYTRPLPAAAGTVPKTRRVATTIAAADMPEEAAWGCLPPGPGSITCVAFCERAIKQWHLRQVTWLKKGCKGAVGWSLVFEGLFVHTVHAATHAAGSFEQNLCSSAPPYNLRGSFHSLTLLPFPPVPRLYLRPAGLLHARVWRSIVA